MAARDSDYGWCQFLVFLRRLPSAAIRMLSTRSDTAFQHDLLDFSLLPSAQE